MSNTVIEMPNKQGLPYTYTVSDAQKLAVRAAFAQFDGTGASGTFLCCLTLKAPDGKVFCRVFPSTSVAAGSSADVSYAPFPGGMTSSSSSGALVKIYDSLLSAPAASFDFSSIPQTYSHMMWITSLRVDGAVVDSSGHVLVNGNALANTYEYFDSSGTTISGPPWPLFTALGANASAGHYGVQSTLVHDYSISRTDHTWHGTNAQVGSGNTFDWHTSVRSGQSCFGPAHTITDVAITPADGTNFAAGSHVTVYGLT